MVREDLKDYEWELVQSSHIRALYFDPSGQIPCDIPAFEYGYLYVAFKNGNIYQYAGISRSNYRAILTAESIGSALYNLVTIVQEGTLVDRMDLELETQHDGGR